MPVSAEIHRNRIGSFLLSSTRKSLIIRVKSAKSLETYYRLTGEIKRHRLQLRLLCLLIYILTCVILLSRLEPPPAINQDIQNSENMTQARPVSDNNVNISQALLQWDSGLTINKLCHILFGNKRNIGFKYLSWNCDRGFIAHKKVEDIKLFAQKYKPDFMAISEVDLRRDENNKYENSTNVLSTCQVYDKLNIEGFQLFLPPSWAIHNTARLIVYANNELNLKLKPVLPTETHLQNIILEAGYGKSKTHYVNFFYREWKNSVTGKNDYAAQLADLSLLSDIWRRCLAEARTKIS